MRSLCETMSTIDFKCTRILKSKYSNCSNVINYRVVYPFLGCLSGAPLGRGPSAIFDQPTWPVRAWLELLLLRSWNCFILIRVTKYLFQHLWPTILSTIQKCCLSISNRNVLLHGNSTESNSHLVEGSQHRIPTIIDSKWTGEYNRCCCWLQKVQFLIYVHLYLLLKSSVFLGNHFNYLKLKTRTQKLV